MTEAVVGRSALLTELRELVGRAAGRAGGLILVEGEAGIGKTTVASALASAVGAGDGSGLAVIWAVCRGDSGLPAFWPWAELLHAHLDLLDPEQRRAVTAGTGSPLAAEDESRSRSAEGRAAARFQLYRQVAGVLERAATARPALYVLDDLHCADVGSALLLAHVAAALPRWPLAVVATLRRGEPGGGDLLAAALDEVRAAAQRRVALPGLAAEHVAELVEAAGLPASASDELVPLLVERTGGNPLFVSELLRSLAASTGDLAPARIVASEVPATVVDVVQRRLARLPHRVADLLSTAAVIGSDVDLTVLGTAVGLGPVELLELVDVAEAAGLVSTAAPGRLRFSHAVVCDAIAAGVPAATRCRLHLRALAAREAAASAPRAELARHALAALPLGDADRAVALASAAGEAALAGLAFEEASEWCAAALRVVPPDDGERRARLLTTQGKALRARGAIGPARAAFGEAARLAVGDPALLAQAALGYADQGADLGVAYRSQDPAILELLERALAAQPEEDTAERAELLSRLAAELYFSEEPERSRPLAEAAVATADRLGEPRLQVAAGAVHHDAFVVGNAEVADQLAGSGQLLALARRSGDTAALLAAHRARVFDLVTAGDLDGVRAEASAFDRLATPLRMPGLLWWPALWRAMLALLAGRHEAAEAAATEAFALGEEAFAEQALGNLLFLQFFLRREQGRLAELEAGARAYVEALAEVPAVSVSLGVLLAETGQLDEAAGILARLGADDFARLRDRNWPVSWFLLARMAYLVGDAARGAELLDLGRRFAGQCVMVSLATVCLGAADLGLAWVAEAAGQPGEAERHYTAAEATNARIGARSWLAQARADHAHLLAARSAETGDDAVRARDLAELAHAAAREIGMPPIVERTERLLAADPGPPPPSPAGGAVFCRDGAVWELGYAGTTVRLPHAKGLADLARLLADPGTPLPAIELLAGQGAALAVTGGAGGEVLDARARRELRARLVELDTELAGAEADHDLERAARVRLERDALIDAVTAAVGLGGRARRLDDPVERARKTVTARIRKAIGRIERVHPTLGHHLQRSVDTGTWCVYSPERPTRWRT